MMNALALLFGIALPTLNGSLFLRLLEGSHPMLARGERWTLGCVSGLTLSMFLVFLFHVTFGMPLSIVWYLIVQIICSSILFYFWKKSNYVSLQSTIVFPGKDLSKWLVVLFAALGTWVIAKTVITASVFLFLTPTYLDDSVDNWNMRGKMFYVDHAITLVIPNEDPAVSPKGVSSYPPTVPLIKAWLASLRGNWNDPLINGIHVVWYIAALILVFYTIRRHAHVFWALTGTYILSSMPLYLMHGTNPYADAFLSVHVFAAVAMLFHASRAISAESRMTFLRLGAIFTALLPFTKNEGMIVYLPPLLLLLGIMLWQWSKAHTLSRKQIVEAILWYGIALLCIAGPWLLFKWSHGLTFGNGKSFTSLDIGWQKNVLLSIFINTFFEANWLLLFPLLFGLLIWRWKAAYTDYFIPTAFFLILYIGQGLLYMFTGLSTEALRQTGYARGLVQLMPVIVVLATFLLKATFPSFALAKNQEMAGD